MKKIDFITVGKPVGGYLGETFTMIEDFVSIIMEEIEKQKPIRIISISEKKNTKYGIIKTYIGHESGFFICELFDSSNNRNGIFLASRNPTQILKEQIESVKLMSKIEVNNGGYIFLGKDQSKQVVLLECPNDSKEQVKVQIRITIPYNKSDDWDVTYETRVCGNNITNHGDKNFLERINKKLLDILLQEVKTINESTTNVYGVPFNNQLDIGVSL